MTIWQQILTMLLIRSMHRTARKRERKTPRYTREQREAGIL